MLMIALAPGTVACSAVLVCHYDLSTTPIHSFLSLHWYSPFNQSIGDLSGLARSTRRRPLLLLPDTRKPTLAVATTTTAAVAAAVMGKESFARIPISDHAATVLASFPSLSSIQFVALSHFIKSRQQKGGPVATSCILHAPARRLPIYSPSRRHSSPKNNDWVAFCLTPTRELAA
jgi:hypothetical protein